MTRKSKATAAGRVQEPQLLRAARQSLRADSGPRTRELVPGSVHGTEPAPAGHSVALHRAAPQRLQGGERAASAHVPRPAGLSPSCWEPTQL